MSIHELMQQALARLSWMLQDENCTPEQARAWMEQAKDYLREIVATERPSYSLENEYNYMSWLMAQQLLRSWEKL